MRRKSVRNVPHVRFGPSGQHRPHVRLPVWNHNWLTNQPVELNRSQWDIKRGLVLKGMLELVNAMAKSSNTCPAMIFHFVVFIPIGLSGIPVDSRMVWAVNEMKNSGLILETVLCYVDQPIRIQIRIRVGKLAKLSLARCQPVVSTPVGHSNDVDNIMSLKSVINIIEMSPTSVTNIYSHLYDIIEYTYILAGWTEWSNWTKCSVECGETGLKSRTRSCSGAEIGSKWCRCGVSSPDIGCVGCLTSDWTKMNESETDILDLIIPGYHDESNLGYLQVEKCDACRKYISLNKWCIISEIKRISLLIGQNGLHARSHVMVVSQVVSESVSMELLAYQKVAHRIMLLKQKSVRLNRAVSLDNDLEMTSNNPEWHLSKCLEYGQNGIPGRFVARIASNSVNENVLEIIASALKQNQSHANVIYQSIQ